MLKDALPTYDIGMLEQMSMVYILMQDPDMIKRMYFEHGYCFNCWYRNMDDPRIDHPAFVVHFAGETSHSCAAVQGQETRLAITLLAGTVLAMLCLCHKSLQPTDGVTC